MSDASSMAGAVVEAIERKVAAASEGGERTVLGTYRGEDAQGKPWVLIAGADEPTPVRRMSVQAEVGDTVTVTVGNGMAVVDSNVSNPSASASNVERVDGKATVAQETATEAIDYAVQASTAASNAQASADAAGYAARNAQASADSAQADAARANDAATRAVADAATAQASATSAVADASTAKSMAQSATTAATNAGTAAALAQAAADAAQGDIDEHQSYFWHDNLGSHILSEQSGYRNDLSSTGMAIRSLADSATVAEFGKDGIQIGTDDQSHLAMDYHSFTLVDSDELEYAHFSDLRNQQGYLERTNSFAVQTAGTQPEIFVPLMAVIGRVFVNDGTGDLAYTTSSRRYRTYITLESSTAAQLVVGDVVHVTYAISNGDATKAYTLGVRDINGIIGPTSYAFGLNVISSDYTSHASGLETSATGVAAHSEGVGSKAQDYAAHAEGNYTTASGEMSHAEGSVSTASGNASHAEGEGSWASGTVSHAEGSMTTASGVDSHAEGIGSSASGVGSHAEGSSTASGHVSHAEGEGTTASGTHSHSQGEGTVANSYCQTALGMYNVADTPSATGNGTYAVIIGNGSSGSPSNALTVDWSGNVSCGNVNGVDVTDMATLTDLADYLPLTGGTLTGSLNGTLIGAKNAFYINSDDTDNEGYLYFHSANRNSYFVRLYGAADGNGDAISIGDGGLTIIGGGESPHNLYAALGIAAGSERLYLSSDNNVYIVPNCQTIANRLEWQFDTSSALVGPNGSQFQASGTNGQAYIMSGYNSSNHRAQMALAPSDDTAYVRYYNGSAWGSWERLANCSTSNTWLAGQQQYFNGNKNWSHRDTQMDLTDDTNGYTSGTRYHEWLSYDKNNYIPGGVSNQASSNGSVSTVLRCRNYKTGTTTAVDNNITLTVAKDGTRSVSVTEAAKWRSALGLYCTNAKWLYNNASGTTGTVTLNTSAANYTMIDIFFLTNDGEWGFTSVCYPNGRKVLLSNAAATATTQMMIKSKRVTISGTSITNTTLNSAAGGEAGVTSSNSCSFTSSVNVIKICYVLGRVS